MKAFLKIYDKEEILEINFEGLNEPNTHMEVELNKSNINFNKFLEGFSNMVFALNNYAENMFMKTILGKIFGLI